MKIFSGTSNISLAEKVAKCMGLELCFAEVHVFPDGERRIRIADSVVGEDTVIIQSAATPVDSNYMELFFIVDALKRSGAKTITAVVPYFGYQRQDHVFRDGEAVSLEVMIKILESVGVNRFVSFDLHSIKIPELFHIPVSHLSALKIFAHKIREEKWENSDTVLVSPDMGGIRRIKILSELLDNMSYVAVEKNRDLETGIVSADQLEHGNVKGKKRAILVDDMISSGGTIILAGNLLQSQGIEEVYVFATHPVFSLDATEKLEKSFLKKVFVTDTVFVPDIKRSSKLEILSVAQDIAQAVQSFSTRV